MSRFVLVGALALGFATGAVAKPTAPVTGALAASDERPAAGARVVLYLNVTAEADVGDLRVALRLPDGVGADGGAPTTQSYGRVRAGETRTLAVPVLVRDAAPRRVIATATVADTPTLTLARDFVLDLNAALPSGPAGTPGVDAQGERLRVFPSGK